MSEGRLGASLPALEEPLNPIHPALFLWKPGGTIIAFTEHMYLFSRTLLPNGCSLGILITSIKMVKFNNLFCTSPVKRVRIQDPSAKSHQYENQQK